MPFYRSINIDSDTKIYFWKIQETSEQLLDTLTITENCLLRLSQMKSEIHRRGFLSVRRLILLAGFQVSDLYYNSEGKPCLPNGHYISISHSFDFSVIMLSNKPVGIDIEKQREKIISIAPRFTSLDERKLFDPLSISSLTAFWCAKEAVYKYLSKKKVSFRQHLFIESIDKENLNISLRFNFGKEKRHFDINYFEIENFMCGYIF